jgi:hypothetical protein
VADPARRHQVQEHLGDVSASQDRSESLLALEDEAEQGVQAALEGEALPYRERRRTAVFGNWNAHWESRCRSEV